jgi:hypothetical protein
MRIFGPKRDEVTGQLGKLHNLYSSPSIFRVIKSVRIRWAGHVTRVGVIRVVYRVLVGIPGERVHLQDPDVDGRIISR